MLFLFISLCLILDPIVFFFRSFFCSCIRWTNSESIETMENGILHWIKIVQIQQTNNKVWYLYSLHLQWRWFWRKAKKGLWRIVPKNANNNNIKMISIAKQHKNTLQMRKFIVIIFRLNGFLYCSVHCVAHSTASMLFIHTFISKIKKKINSEQKNHLVFSL